LYGAWCLKGTRITLDMVLSELEHGASPKQILKTYPSLRAEHLTAAIAYAAEIANDDSASPMKHVAKGIFRGKRIDLTLLHSSGRPIEPGTEVTVYIDDGEIEPAEREALVAALEHSLASPREESISADDLFAELHRKHD